MCVLRERCGCETLLFASSSDAVSVRRSCREAEAFSSARFLRDGGGRSLARDPHGEQVPGRE